MRRRSRVFYATGSTTPVLVEVITSYNPGAATTAYTDALASIARCHTISILAGTEHLTGPATATLPVLTTAPSQSYQANLTDSTLHAGIAVIHEHTVDIAIAYLTRSAPDPQTLETYAQRAATKVTSAGV